MNSPDNNDQTAGHTLVDRRTSLVDPAYRAAFAAEMKKLAGQLAQKIGDNGAADNTKSFRSELAHLFKNAEYEAYRCEDDGKIVFRLLHPDHRYQPCKDFTPHAGQLILYPGKDGTPCVPLRLAAIPLDITIEKITAIGGSVGKTLLNALSAPANASESAAANPDDKIAALLAAEKEREAARTAKEWAEAQAAERLEQKKLLRQRRQTPLTPEQKKAAQEVTQRLQIAAELKKLEIVADSAARVASHEVKLAARLGRTAQKLAAEIKRQPQMADNPNVAKKLAGKKESLKEAKTRAAAAKSMLIKSQKAVAAYKKRYNLADPEPVKPVPAKFSPEQQKWEAWKKENPAQFISTILVAAALAQAKEEQKQQAKARAARKKLAKALARKAKMQRAAAAATQRQKHHPIHPAPRFTGPLQMQPTT